MLTVPVTADRQHNMGLDTHAEEQARYPVLSSSTYGSRPPIDTLIREHARKPVVKTEFFRATGTQLN